MRPFVALLSVVDEKFITNLKSKYKILFGV